MLSDDLLQQALQVAKTFDQRLEIFVSEAPRPEAFRDKLKLPPKGAVDVNVYDPATVPRRIRVESRVQESMLIEKVMPVCPQPAGEAAAAGVVQLAVIVSKDGTVMQINPLAGPQLLIDPAIEAVRQWKYRPMLLNGLPVEVQTAVDVPVAANLG